MSRGHKLSSFKTRYELYCITLSLALLSNLSIFYPKLSQLVQRISFTTMQLVFLIQNTLCLEFSGKRFPTKSQTKLLLSAAAMNTSSVPTAGIFATYPTDLYPISTTILFFDQFFGTRTLTLIVNGLTESRQPNPNSPSLIPLLVGLIVVALGLCMGVNCGYAINPARDLGPRIFSSFLYGTDVFIAHDYFFWIPIVAPILGGTAGALLYIALVGGHYDDVEKL